MESLGVLKLMEDKTLLVTGATGFLAKVFMEKILRIQPKVKKLYLLIRAEDAKSAMQRLFNDIVEKELFKVLKDARGKSILETFIFEKVVAVPGNVSLKDLGVRDFNLKEQMRREIDFIVNCAATTRFDERYDIALGTNTMGAFHVLGFAQKCVKAKMVLHVSTAYACGESSGLIRESPIEDYETLNKICKLDIITEKKMVEEKLRELQTDNANNESIITSVMKDLGNKRAKLYGWPNMYVFTKAMGEMLLGYCNDNTMPIIIIRPTIVTSTFKEPFPGWTEGLRTIDGLIVAYGKGKLQCMLANPDTVVDLIPVDMVMNSMIMAMVANANQHSSPKIYHICSSMRNPLKFSDIHKFTTRYFTKNPCVNEKGKPIIVPKITILESSARFHIYIAIKFTIPLKGLKFMNLISCGCCKHVYNDSNKKFKLMMRFIELYKPYMFFKGTFDDTNAENLRDAIRIREEEVDSINFEPKCIDWGAYLINTHIPGLMRYVVKY